MRRLRWKLVVAAGVLALLTQGVFVVLGLGWKRWADLSGTPDGYSHEDVIWISNSSSFADLFTAIHVRHFPEESWVHRFPGGYSVLRREEQFPNRKMPVPKEAVFDADSDVGKTLHHLAEIGWPLRCFRVRTTLAEAFADVHFDDKARLATLIFDRRGESMSVRVLWWSSSVNMFAVGASWWVGLAGLMALRGKLRVRRGKCAGCGYDVRRLEVCSECGLRCVKTQEARRA